MAWAQLGATLVSANVTVLTATLVYFRDGRNPYRRDELLQSTDVVFDACFAALNGVKVRDQPYLVTRS